MVNYYANARSNYFRVKDLTAFTREADRLGLEILSGDGNGRVMVTPRLADFDDGAWPSVVWDEDTGEAENFDIAQWVAGHLEDGEVAIFQEVGAEELRYLTGYSIAVNSKGEKRVVALSDIWEQAKELGEHATPVLH